jgi:hypothetical protein
MRGAPAYMCTCTVCIAGYSVGFTINLSLGVECRCGRKTCFFFSRLDNAYLYILNIFAMCAIVRWLGLDCAEAKNSVVHGGFAACVL